MTGESLQTLASLMAAWDHTGPLLSRNNLSLKRSFHRIVQHQLLALALALQLPLDSFEIICDAAWAVGGGICLDTQEFNLGVGFFSLSGKTIILQRRRRGKPDAIRALPLEELDVPERLARKVRELLNT